MNQSAMTNRDGVLVASFRDPSGFVFLKDGVLYRQINTGYRLHYEQLKESGLYDKLTANRRLVSHEETSPLERPDADAYRVIKPLIIPFISYPYEWCFSALKDAALTTLDVQLDAIGYGMTLKDASAYNIQFLDGRPVLIDTLSFEIRKPGAPWVAYRQFCQHFVAPLALMSYVDVRLSQLLRTNIDGVPLDLASRLLPARTRFKPSLFFHVYLHAASQKRYANGGLKNAWRPRISEKGIKGLVSSLRTAVAKMTWKPPRTEWGDYYLNTNYTDRAEDKKAVIVSEILETLRPQWVWDLGANTGRYSRLAGSKGASVVAFDVDPAAVEANYRQIKTNKETNLLALLLDLTNPSSGIGWRNRERQPIHERGRPDAILALALIHHLAITNNVPFDHVALLFRQLGGALVIEFVPKSDSKVAHLLATRRDIFPNYDRGTFEKTFSRYYRIERTIEIPESERSLYLMRSK